MQPFYRTTLKVKRIGFILSVGNSKYTLEVFLYKVSLGITNLTKEEIYASN